jgi:anaerobic ribonucleoside-triphosphate reductase
MTILESVRSVSAYPIPTVTVREFAERQGLNIDAVITNEVRESAALKTALAEVYAWLAEAPNISQGGMSYSLNDEQRQYYRAKAESLRIEAGIGTQKRRFGVKGRLL